MRNVWMVCALAVLGCGAQQGTDAGWVPASEALRQHGVAALLARPTANGQQVLLRDGSSETIGELSLVQSDASSTVRLQFRSDEWTQVIVAASGQMTITLDGRTATLRWDGSGWIGDPAAQALLAESQPYTDFVQLVGGEAKLGISVDVGGAQSGDSSGAAASDGPAKPADMSTSKPPPLCCGDLVTAASGWAWYWEKNPKAMACKRATDTLQALCAVSSGFACCNLPEKAACTACVNWGTGWACSQAGYLQYVCQ
jgi:hypothetical protein